VAIIRFSLATALPGLVRTGRSVTEATPRRGTGREKMGQENCVAIGKTRRRLGDEPVVFRAVARLQGRHRAEDAIGFDRRSGSIGLCHPAEFVLHSTDAGRKRRKHADVPTRLQCRLEHRFIGLEHRDRQSCGGGLDRIAKRPSR
jgi:hypothetical protein